MKGDVAMKIFVDESCVGCGLCAELCPEVFFVLNNDKAEIKEKHVEENFEKVQTAAESCPVEAIVLDGEER